MVRVLILLWLITGILSAQTGDVRYFFNGRERVSLNLLPSERVMAWRILATSRIAQATREFEKHLSIFNRVGIKGDKLAIMYGGWASRRTEALFRVLEKTGQAQRLRTFQKVGGGHPLIEFPEIYVRLKPGLTAAGLLAGLRAKGYRPAGASEGLHGWAFLALARPEETLMMADALNRMPDLAEFAEPAFRWTLSSPRVLPEPPDDPGPSDTVAGAPNDFFFARQWAWYKPEGSGILAAWPFVANKPERAIRVAILDSPIDLEHPDLRPVLDTAHQFNAATQLPHERNRLMFDSDPAKRDDHGTACAGVVAAVRGNGIGVAGVASNVSIIPIQVVSVSDNTEAITGPSIAEGIRYALDAGADIISLSANTTLPDYVGVIRMALDQVEKIQKTRNVVFVNSTGTDHDGRTQGVDWPARDAANYPFLVAVGASNYCGTLKRVSIDGCNRDMATWASLRDDVRGTLLAPGIGILTTTNVKNASNPGARQNYRRNFFGTSAAAPMVAGVVALMMSKYPCLTAAQIRNTLFETADPIPGTRHRRLNALKALRPPPFCSGSGGSGL